MSTVPTQPNRRQVLKWGTAAGLTGSFLGQTSFASPETFEIPEVQKYNRLGRTDFEISDISFGSSGIRRGQENVVRHAIDRGINYLDTAESYTNGQSETVIGNVVKGMRDKVYIVSKIISYPQMKSEDIMKRLEESLKRLQTDYVDVYMNHAVNDVKRMESPEWHKFVETAKEQGKIRFAGMSGHAGRLAQCLEYSLDQDICDVVLCAYNFGQDPSFMANLTRGMDWIARQPKLPELLKKAKKNDVGTVVMKTLAGARLNDMKPWEKDGSTFSQAAFRWVLSNSDVDALIVSMNSTANIDEFLVASGAEEMSYGDQELLERYIALNNETYCRPGCSDCESSCPYNVQVADVLRTRMYATDYRDVEMARNEYAQLAVNGGACLSCSGTPCQSACTYGVSIAKLSAPTHRILA
ncbi:MAG: aldo/keto reductase [Gammaproteobacteria bacterium]|nr:aldo/keto reductase [Gammaproteobacteria bacterium]